MTKGFLLFIIALWCMGASDGLAASKRKAKARTKTPHTMTQPGSNGSTVPRPPKNAVTAPQPSQAVSPSGESVRQESRIEFDERMLRGQSASGVIYLFQRTPSDWKSIVTVPESFRARTTAPLSPAEERK